MAGASAAGHKVCMARVLARYIAVSLLVELSLFTTHWVDCLPLFPPLILPSISPI